MLHKATGINPVRSKTPKASVTVAKKSTSNGIKSWPEDDRPREKLYDSEEFVL